MAAVDVVGAQTNSQEDNEPSNEELLRNLANDYASYLNVDFSKERKCLEENIEEMLLRLDEFVGLIDMIRSDDTQCLIRSMPDINAKCQELKKIFVKIDNLEVFVKRVRHDVDVMEEKINIAEKELRPENSFSKVLKPFFKKKHPGNKQKSPIYDPPEIFRTSQYLPSCSSDISDAESA